MLGPYCLCSLLCRDIISLNERLPWHLYFLEKISSLSHSIVVFFFSVSLLFSSVSLFHGSIYIYIYTFLCLHTFIHMYMPDFCGNKKDFLKDILINIWVVYTKQIQAVENILSMLISTLSALRQLFCCCSVLSIFCTY